ncbi:hypothetical protein PHMEG_00037541 [Phytophthora megakarya]|uniref:Uncharacterized protein n=1 Tax=Phytophthora megakarya TaxID=4795 RepID=A0A225UJ70_9STRA|nr:hypothetical protein PHMEG_00037541 [Phytophthora megakarya]
MKRVLEPSELLEDSVDKKQRVVSDALPLDQQAIDSFIRDGFVLLPNRLAQDHITKDSSTWVERHGIPGAMQLSSRMTLATTT